MPMIDEKDLIKAETAGPGLVLTILLKEVEMFTAPALREVLEKHTDTRPPVLILDFSNTSHLDSSGLAVVYKTSMNIRKYGGHFCVTGLNRNLSQLLQMFKEKEDIEIYPTVEGGRRALGLPV